MTSCVYAGRIWTAPVQPMDLSLLDLSLPSPCGAARVDSAGDMLDYRS